MEEKKDVRIDPDSLDVKKIASPALQHLVGRVAYRDRGIPLDPYTGRPLYEGGYNRHSHSGGADEPSWPVSRKPDGSAP